MTETTEELEKFDDVQEDDETIIEIPKEVRKIKTQAYDKSVSDIIRMINDGDINLNPEYQRNYIWNNKKASMLIESIILNVPIPVIYVSQEDDDTWTVIDGLQRLSSLKRFFDRDFKLSGLEILTDLNKSDIKSLNPKALRVLRNGLLRVIMISNDSHPEIKYDVFMRLNNGAVKLNDQELRNCLYRGDFNEQLKELAKNKTYLKLMKLSKPHNRMRDCELILRFFAFQANYNEEEEVITNYKGRMKTYLNDFMRENQKLTEGKLETFKVLFQDTMKKVDTTLGVNAFRRFNEEGDYETALNRSLMDIILVSFSKVSQEELSEHKDEIQERLKYLMMKDADFIRGITRATSDKDVVNFRMKAWMNELNNIVSHV